MGVCERPAEQQVRFSTSRRRWWLPLGFPAPCRDDDGVQEVAALAGGGGSESIQRGQNEVSLLQPGRRENGAWTPELTQ